MANTNTTTSVVDTIFARSLMALREMSIMPRYVNREYDPTPGEKMSAINVPVPSAIAAQAVTPSNTPPDDDGVAPTNVTMTLDKWYETVFFMNDKEVQEIVNGVFEGQVSEAVRGLANQVDSDILALYPAVYGFAGTPGTAPFGTGLDELSAARSQLTKQLASKANRVCVMDEDAEANAVLLPQIQRLDWAGPEARAALREGELGRTLGFQLAVDNLIPTHTTAAAGTPLVDDSSGIAVGAKTVHMDGFTTKPEAGDIFRIAGDTQYYTVTSSTTLVGTDSDVSFEPGLKVAIPTGDGNEVVTFENSHVVNLAFSRDCFALAARPMANNDPFGLANVGGFRRSIMDPVSGLAFTMEIQRQHYRTAMRLSALYGVKCVRPEFGARIAG